MRDCSGMVEDVMVENLDRIDLISWKDHASKMPWWRKYRFCGIVVLYCLTRLPIPKGSHGNGVSTVGLVASAIIGR